MDSTTLITILTSVLGGGGLGAILSYKLSTRKENTNEFSTIIDEYKSLIDKQESRVKNLELKVFDLEEKNRLNIELISRYENQVNELRHQLLIFEGSHLDLPLPMWMKDTKGIMIFINDYYEDSFLIPRGYTTKDYIGHDDFSVWSDKVANEFISNDKKVMRTKRMVRTVEELEDGVGGVFYAEVLKYPRMLNRNIIGISGIILRTSDTKFEV